MNGVESRAVDLMYQKNGSTIGVTNLTVALQDLDSRLDALLASEHLKTRRQPVDTSQRDENPTNSAIRTQEQAKPSEHPLSKEKPTDMREDQPASSSKLTNGKEKMEASGSQVQHKAVTQPSTEEKSISSKKTSKCNHVTSKNKSKTSSKSKGKADHTPSRTASADSGDLKSKLKADPTPSKAGNSDLKIFDQGDLKSSRIAYKAPIINGIREDFKFVCVYCAVTFKTQAALRMHCQTEAHQTIIMSDDGKDWKWRPPPRGHTSDAYTLCVNWEKHCRYGNQCVEAHSPEELQEWCERFDYRKMKLQRAKEKELYGKSYTEQLLERWSQSLAPETVLGKEVDYVEEHISDDLSTSVVSKDSKKIWKFTLKAHKFLHAVALLEDAHRNHFAIKSIQTIINESILHWTPANAQEWLIPEKSSVETHLKKASDKANLCHTVVVEFSTDIFGTFRQSVVFDFGCDPLLLKHFCVDVLPAANACKIDELKKELFSTERWEENTVEIIRFSPRDPSCPPGFDDEKDAELLKKYPTPTPSTFMLTQSTVKERKLTKNNYQSRMHELISVEEMARYQQISRYNLRTTLTIASSYLLSSSGPTSSTAKYAQSGQLYAVMHFGKAISEDTAAGRLVLNNCTSVLLSAAESGSNKGTGNQKETEECSSHKRKVYEALVEDKGKNVIYIKLSADTVKALKMKAGVDFVAAIQFQLNRIQYCEWHAAVDKISDYRILFPETIFEPSIPWSPHRQWKDIPDTKLNVKQKEAIMAITTPSTFALPPVLIIGPFGTGKTYTLAQAIKQLLTVDDTRILVCTHSNSAADLYIHDYLHPYVQAGNECARPLRVYYHKRWVSTVNPIVQQYCLINPESGLKQFRIPTLEDIEKHRVIVVTLSNSSVLVSLGLRKDFFTHIFLDEAAQAMECEAIMPLALAGEKTRIVLAGDHMQLSPELFSPFAIERNLHLSLLERLYDHYPSSFPCKILLCENYRAHEAIIKFTSELFYDQKLVCSGKQPSHDRFYPLTFFTSRGEDVQDTNSTAFYNNAEVYEIVERVIELRGCWPTSWGKLDAQSIGIMTPYSDQVFRIRAELRRRKLSNISVERVLNVQGKQFRAIFLSTVRTRRTCSSQKKTQASDENDYGFLSNSKLLNTAITRAQSLVAVVGDPIALCSIGRCRKVWERFIQTCHENKSLFGIQWSNVRAHLDEVELKTTYGLNPLAPEFVPRNRTVQNRAPVPFVPPVLNSSGVALVLGPNGPQPALLLEGYQPNVNHHPIQPNVWSGPPIQYQQLPPMWQMPQNMGTLPNVPQISQLHQRASQPGVPVQSFQGTYQQQPPIWPRSLAGQQFHIQANPLVTMANPIVLPTTDSQNRLYNNCQPGQVQSSAVHTTVLRAPEPLVSTSWSAPASMPTPIPAPLAAPGSAPVAVSVPGTVSGAIALPPPGMAPRSGASLISNGLTILPSTNDVITPNQILIPAAMDVTNMNFLANNSSTGPVNSNVLNTQQLQSNMANSAGFRVEPPLLPSTSDSQVQAGDLKDQIFSSPQNQSWTAHLNYQEQFRQQQLQQQQLLYQQHLLQQQQQQQHQQQQQQQHQHLLQQQSLLQQLQLSQLHLHQLQQKQFEEQQRQLLHLQQQQMQQQQQQQMLYTDHLRLTEQQQLQLQQQQQMILVEQQRLSEQQEREQREMLKEHRKLILSHILTPLVRRYPEWHQLIPGGVNLLVLVDQPEQQKGWYHDLLRMRKLDMACLFHEFMDKCSSVISRNWEILAPFPPQIQSGYSSPVNMNRVEFCEHAALNGPEEKEPVIMMRDLDPQYMLGGDLGLGGNSVWSFKADQFQQTSNGSTNFSCSSRKLSTSRHRSQTSGARVVELLSESDDSGDELLSSINRQLHLEDFL